MAKEYKVGEKYYLPVTVKSICPGYNYPIELGFIDSNLCDTDDTTSIADEPDVLLTADEIATVINTERDDALEELKARNAELEALLKEVTATRDEAIRQNDELLKENDNLRSQVGKNLAEIQNLSSEVHFLKAQKEVKKPVHVFTNDGTEVEFRRYTSVQYRTDYNILVIKDGEEIVAGFIRGDRPGNLAYWWTE